MVAVEKRGQAFLLKRVLIIVTLLADPIASHVPVPISFPTRHILGAFTPIFSSKRTPFAYDTHSLTLIFPFFHRTNRIRKKYIIPNLRRQSSHFEGCQSLLSPWLRSDISWFFFSLAFLEILIQNNEQNT